MKEQNKQAERDFFNSGTANINSDHPSDNTHINECYQLLGIPETINGSNMLECGCGIGEWGRVLAKRGAKVFGVDIADEAIAANRRISLGINNYECKVGDLEDQSLFEAKSLDVITCFNVLHHFPSIDKVLKNFEYWLKDGGIIYVVEPNGGNPSHKVGKFVRLFLPSSFVMNNGLATPNEMHDWSMDEYEASFGVRGFECEMKLSLEKGDSKIPRGMSLVDLIAKTRWIICKLMYYFTSPINRGNPLIFKMVRIPR